ncbi:MAG: Uma2 family endonuclease [Burkholderiales bacterium]|uniref:Uma2 family endonuclease n=1 Tax=Roseateles sp. TaxID=1971397 RepID=UPI000FB04671|nr:MAG: Uma2 family endonuclease [Burkholderiales bacterium]
MGQAATEFKLNPEDYLAWEALQQERHEYVDGEVFNMSGAEDRHVTVALNAAMALRQHTTGSPCRVFMTDMKLQVASSKAYFYPDVFVTCSAADRASPLVKQEATLIIEVLSPSTAAYDRGAKFAHYRGIPTLQEYALIDIDLRRTDVYRKGAEGLWVLHPFEAGQAVTLASADLTISARELFAEVDDETSEA